ncbi:Rid family hydrolase [Guyparkeria sp.]|uniref:chorismate transformation enzyme, FkbO/Hyg5 family n=1 Tax=Guyparkeria sp. TaxID=2035736 RepID=UPI003970C994
MTQAATNPATVLRSPERLLGALITADTRLVARGGCVAPLPLTVLEGEPKHALEAFLAPAENRSPPVTSRDALGCTTTAGHWTFGQLPIDESRGLAVGAEAAYTELLARVAREGTPHLWRVWHYLPAINATDPETGIERYRLFNQGRAAAFTAANRPAGPSAPAACALGSPADTSGRLVFLASDSPAIGIENPRQVSAWNYPRQYGHKSPLFARAAIARGPRHDWLFISGTASITGHATRHRGDVYAQTDETLTNLQAVLDEANARRPADCRAFDWNPTTHLRVYLRHPDDLAAVRARLDQQLSAVSRRVFLQADICREDLLVEIEATVHQPRDENDDDRLWPEL